MAVGPPRCARTRSERAWRRWCWGCRSAFRRRWSSPRRSAGGDGAMCAMPAPMEMADDRCMPEVGQPRASTRIATTTTAVVLQGLRGLRSVHGGPFDLDIGRGECVSLMGPSGSGNSLLMRLIADLDPGTGTVRLHGRQRDAWSAPEGRRQVVYAAAVPAWWAPSGH